MVSTFFFSYTDIYKTLLTISFFEPALFPADFFNNKPKEKLDLGLPWWLKSPPAKAGDTGSIPGLGGSHML